MTQQLKLLDIKLSSLCCSHQLSKGLFSPLQFSNSRPVPPHRVPELLCFASAVGIPATAILAATVFDLLAFEGQNTPSASL